MVKVFILWLISYQLTLLLLVRESCKWDAGFYIYTLVQQLLWLLLYSLCSTSGMYTGSISVSPFRAVLLVQIRLQKLRDSKFNGYRSTTMVNQNLSFLKSLVTKLLQLCWNLPNFNLKIASINSFKKLPFSNSQLC